VDSEMRGAESEDEHDEDDDSWEVVDEDGSPCGEKTFLLWNPPVRDLAPAPAAAGSRKKPPRPNPNPRENLDEPSADRDADVEVGVARGKSAVAAR